jgi:hypothetical protein
MSANTRVLIIALSLLVAMASGCRDVAEPESAETAAYLSGGDNSGEHQKRMAEMLAAYGIDIEESGGIFGIGWRNRSRPDDVDPEARGRGRAIAFGEALEDGRRRGIDMGTVTLSYPGDQVELTKRERPKGGTVYTSSSGPRHENPTSIGFAGDGEYEFDVSGSDAFAAVKLSVTAPSELMSITSHSRGDTVDRDEDLVIEWSGGGDGKVAIAFAALTGERPAKQDRPNGGRGDGGRRGRHGGGLGGPGRRGGGHPKPANVLHEMIDGNNGEYTLAADRLAELVGDSGATRIAVHVSQLIASDVDHDGETLWAVLHTGDRVMLRLE